MRLRDLALSVAVFAALPPTIAHAQSAPAKEHAKKLFDEGLELEKKNDYAGALAKYKEAEASAVTAGLRFHKGYCLEMLGKLSTAQDEYDAAERLAREQNKPDVRTAILARLEPIRARVPQIAVRFTGDIKGGEVQVDGEKIAAPLLEGKSFRIDPGDHVVTAKAPGYKNWKRDVHVVEAITTTVDIAMDRDGSAPPPPVVVAPVASAGAQSKPAPADPLTEPPRENDRSRSVVAPVVATVGAVTLVVTGVVFFAVAGSAKSTADTECLQKVDCGSEQSKIRTFDTLALGSFIGAAGLGVLSVVLWTSGSKSSASAPSTRIVATPTGAGITGAF